MPTKLIQSFCISSVRRVWYLLGNFFVGFIQDPELTDLFVGAVRGSRQACPRDRTGRESRTDPRIFYYH
jgi:hypothetical protein